MSRFTRTAVFSMILLTVAWTGADERVSLTDLPPGVRDAALAAVPGIELVAAELERTSRGTVYEVEGVAGGKRYEIEVSDRGEVLEVELETDEQVALDRLPAAVVDAARIAVPGIELIEAELVTLRDGGVVYELEGTVDGAEHEILVTTEGRVLKTHVESADDDESEDSASDDDESPAT